MIVFFIVIIFIFISYLLIESVGIGMNKKILSFMSLFCLTLVLSVYYVVVPYNGAIKDLGSEDVVVNVTIDDGEEIYFASLEQSKVDGYQEEIKEYESIVASSNYTNKEKEEALRDIEEVVAKIKLEDEIEKAIKDAGYSNVYLIIKNNIVHVIVKVSEPSSLDAANIIKIIFSYVTPTSYV